MDPRNPLGGHSLKKLEGEFKPSTTPVPGGFDYVLSNSYHGLIANQWLSVNRNGKEFLININDSKHQIPFDPTKKSVSVLYNFVALTGNRFALKRGSSNVDTYEILPENKLALVESREGDLINTPERTAYVINKGKLFEINSREELPIINFVNPGVAEEDVSKISQYLIIRTYVLETRFNLYPLASNPIINQKVDIKFPFNPNAITWETSLDGKFLFCQSVENNRTSKIFLYERMQGLKCREITSVAATDPWKGSGKTQFYQNYLIYGSSQNTDPTKNGIYVIDLTADKPIPEIAVSEKDGEIEFFTIDSSGNIIYVQGKEQQKYIRKHAPFPNPSAALMDKLTTTSLSTMPQVLNNLIVQYAENYVDNSQDPYNILLWIFGLAILEKMKDLNKTSEEYKYPFEYQFWNALIAESELNPKMNYPKRIKELQNEFKLKEDYVEYNSTDLLRNLMNLKQSTHDNKFTFPGNAPQKNTGDLKDVFQKLDKEAENKQKIYEDQKIARERNSLFVDKIKEKSEILFKTREIDSDIKTDLGTIKEFIQNIDNYLKTTGYTSEAKKKAELAKNLKVVLVDAMSIGNTERNRISSVGMDTKIKLSEIKSLGSVVTAINATLNEYKKQSITESGVFYNFLKTADTKKLNDTEQKANALIKQVNDQIVSANQVKAALPGKKR